MEVMNDNYLNIQKVTSGTRTTSIFVSRLTTVHACCGLLSRGDRVLHALGKTRMITYENDHL